MFIKVRVIIFRSEVLEKCFISMAIKVSGKIQQLKIITTCVIVNISLARRKATLFVNVILGFVIMTKAVNEPNSSLAVFGSIFPLTSPIVMMGRIAYDIPSWQIVVSMLCLICSFLFFTWIAGKIYRTGILLYGKKPSWKEMIKWAFAKSQYM